MDATIARERPLNLAVPKDFAGHLQIGTCSWKYDSWKGLIYPSDAGDLGDRYLVEYAKRLGTVEVDQWFWSLFPSGVKFPDPATVQAYAESVPDDFSFADVLRGVNQERLCPRLDVPARLGSLATEGKGGQG